MKIALDCEMIGDVHDRSMLARVTLVDENEQVIYNTFVKPTREVGTYRYELTGINESHFKNAKDFNQGFTERRRALLLGITTKFFSTIGYMVHYL
ncbi:hypothetical protein evm_014528 [Chilo suppressalis]|nr:hypothetical protein evm_014528 [Chilo suppressalis]